MHKLLPYVQLGLLYIMLPFASVAKTGSTIANPQAITGGKSSLSFIENKGQIIDQYGIHRKDIGFKLEANGMVMFVGANQLHYQWYRSNSKCKSQKPKDTFQTDKLKRESPLEGDLGVDIYRLDVQLLNAKPNPEVITEELQDYTENYYLPQCPDGATAKSYKKVTYKNVYPNIDWEILTSPNPSEGGGLKYNFIVHNGGNYKDIQIQYNSATKLELKDGALIATTPFGSITENAPYTYFADSKETIQSNFVLNGNILSYNINHDNTTLSKGERKGEVIIDPIIKWATYYGGSNNDYGQKLGTDTAGNIYMVGNTLSTSNIATTGANQTSYGGGSIDGYLVKFNINGVPQWATYYGGNGSDGFNDIRTDVQGNSYVAGSTSSMGLASSGAHQTSISGPTDGLLVKFSTSGLRQWATYFGSVDYDDAYAVQTDNNGNVYLGLSLGVNSTGLATTGAFQTSWGGGMIVKFNTNGVSQWATYYPVGIVAMASDGSGNIYAVSSTQVITGLATTGSHQTTISGGVDVVLVKFNGNGSRLWATYFGGTVSESHPRVSCDISSNVYLSGYVFSGGTNISTVGAHQTTFNSVVGTNDGFLVKFNSLGVRLWCTYYGGTLNDYITGIVTDSANNVYVSGVTQSFSSIASNNGYQTSRYGNGDVFFAGFNSGGARLFGSYYGGTGDEALTGIESGISFTKNRIVFCKTTNSIDYIATTGAYQTSLGGNIDAFVASFELEDTAVFLKPPFTDTFKCAGDSIHIPYGVTYNFRSTNSFTLQLSNASGSFASPTTLATISGGAAGVFHTIVPLSISTGSGYRLRVIASAPADTSEDNSVDLRYAQYPATPVASANTPLCSGNTLVFTTIGTTGAAWSWTGPGSYTSTSQSPFINNAQTTHSGNYIVTANLNNGCIKKDTVNVVVNQTPAKPNAGSNSPLCSGNTLNLISSSTTSGVSWNWTGPMGFGSTSQNPSIPNVQTNQAGDYIVTATLGPCSNKDTTTVIVNPGPTINTYVNPKDTICAGATVTLVALVTNGGSGPSYQWYKNGNPIGGATLASYTASGLNNGDVFYCQFTPGTGTGCNGTINSSSITITVLPITNPNVSITATPDTNIWQGLNVTFTAIATNCSKPTYQWKLNNNNVNGATSNTWGAATLADNDQVSCVMTCNDPCPNPKDATSNKLTMHVSTGIDGVGSSTFNIYPNPNNGSFLLTSNEKGRLYITNLQGQAVSNYAVENGKTNIPLPKTLTAGVYIGRLVTVDNKTIVLRIVYQP